MKAKDIRELTDEELHQQLQDKTKALMAFKTQMATGVVDNVRAAREARKDIARMKTIVHEREMQAAKGGAQ